MGMDIHLFVECRLADGRWTRVLPPPELRRVLDPRLREGETPLMTAYREMSERVEWCGAGRGMLSVLFDAERHETPGFPQDVSDELSRLMRIQLRERLEQHKRRPNSEDEWEVQELRDALGPLADTPIEDPWPAGEILIGNCPSWMLLSELIAWVEQSTPERVQRDEWAAPTFAVWMIGRVLSGATQEDQARWIAALLPGGPYFGHRRNHPEPYTRLIDFDDAKAMWERGEYPPATTMIHMTSVREAHKLLGSFYHEAIPWLLRRAAPTDIRLVWTITT